MEKQQIPVSNTSLIRWSTTFEEQVVLMIKEDDMYFSPAEERQTYTSGWAYYVIKDLPHVCDNVIKVL